MLKVLFLDIDGVVLSGEELQKSRNRRYLPPHKISLVREVCARSGAVIVVSSTWRHSDDTKGALEAVELPLHPDWRTPLPKMLGGHYTGEQRGREIQHWIDKHPETAAYAIVDDDSDMLTSQMSNFVKTPFQTGIEAAHVNALVSILAQAIDAKSNARPTQSKGDKHMSDEISYDDLMEEEELLAEGEREDRELWERKQMEEHFRKHPHG